MVAFRSRWKVGPIRLAGLGAMALAAMAAHRLVALAQGHPHPLPAIGYALAAVAFLGGSLGAALGLWGAALCRIMPAPGLWMRHDPAPLVPTGRDAAADSLFLRPRDHDPQAP